MISKISVHPWFWTILSNCVTSYNVSNCNVLSDHVKVCTRQSQHKPNIIRIITLVSQRAWKANWATIQLKCNIDIHVSHLQWTAIDTFHCRALLFKFHCPNFHLLRNTKNQFHIFWRGKGGREDDTCWKVPRLKYMWLVTFLTIRYNVTNFRPPKILISHIIFRYGTQAYGDTKSHTCQFSTENPQEHCSFKPLNRVFQKTNFNNILQNYTVAWTNKVCWLQ